MVDLDPDFDVADGETVLWRGQPDLAKTFTRIDLFLVPFSVLWAGLAITFLALFILRLPAAPLPALIFGFAIGFAMAGFGVYFVIGRFFVKRYQKARTTYVLTSLRAVVVRPRSQQDVTLTGTGVHILTSTDSRHITAVFRPTRYRPPLVPSIAEMYANSGLDFWARGAPLAFYDVNDAGGLRAALKSRFGPGKGHRVPPEFAS